MHAIFIDADGCPVKEEVYRVAGRHGLRVTVVSNSRMRVPEADWIESVVVSGSFDAADDWIVEHAAVSDIVVTTDIPLADRTLKKGARVITPTGRLYTEETIGEALAGRELMSYLREMGTVTGGPPPFAARDRSRFLHELDQLIKSVIRASGP